MRVLIVGCGYVGLALGRELVRAGHEVAGIRRNPETHDLSEAGIKPIIADVTLPTALARIEPAFDCVVNTLSSSKGGYEAYHSVYLNGTMNLLNWLSQAPLRKYVYTSSTSVYAQTDGSWVTEESSAKPDDNMGSVLRQAEELLRQSAATHGFPAVILRLAGIYGPKRGHLFQQYLRGEARLDGGGSRIINMIHRDDVVRAVHVAMDRGQPGAIYNVADDEPVTQREFFTWLSDQLHMPMPPVRTEAEPLRRKRPLTNKRVSNRKLRLELGCELKYPTFRQGYSAEIARLQAAGQLPVGPGQ